MCGTTILLLDTEPVVRIVVSDILRRDGYRVFATGSLAEAIAFAREQRLDLFMTNVSIPGSTGRDAAKQIHGICPAAPVLIVAGLPADSRIEDAFTDGALDFFPKPFTAQQLSAKVRQVLGEQRIDTSS